MFPPSPLKAALLSSALLLLCTAPFPLHASNGNNLNDDNSNPRPDLVQEPISHLLLQQEQIAISSDDNPNCRCIPGDACWPSPSQWSRFNQTVSGRLIATVPLASVCYPEHDLYDETKCAQLRENWHLTATHYLDSASVMNQFFARGPDGGGCDAIVEATSFGQIGEEVGKDDNEKKQKNQEGKRCSIGSNVVYSVNASSSTDFSHTMAFAHRHNIRLVIRNTGHDYLGKSTGFGALALWTHHLKDITFFVDFDNTHEAEQQQKSVAAYKGKAARLGAGVQVSDAFAAAKAHGLVLHGGNCESVGVVGGYTQGGGHSVLSSALGLGADQVLEWEVVIPPSPATGHAEPRLVTATPFNEYADLYWALSGGGGGTFGAVVSVTVKAWEDFETAGATLMFGAAGLQDRGIFVKGVQAWLEALPGIVDLGAGAIWFLLKDVLAVSPVMAPGVKANELEQAFRPVMDKLDGLGIPYASSFTDFSSFHDAVAAMVAQQNVTDANMGGRLIPRSLVTEKKGAEKLTAALDAIVSADGIVSGISVNIERARKLSKAYPNSVNPLFESAIHIGVFGFPYNHLDFAANIYAQDKITNVFGAALEKLTPGGGAYLNEGDPHQPDWQTTFYGENYERLLAIKNKYDPEGLLYALTAVGSEQWVQKEDGRLCRA
ncbi:hypothetical protein QBC45DRAFT_424336 [Copromyces sp. CBS 386.78]|nr:hypothetical protein QBC45DRAFT_424336 [Copromyces sp. CBS 386.78]